MKKREITKIVHSLMVAGLAACLLAGCGNAKTESSSDTAVEETTDAEAATESEAAEEQNDANAEALTEENSSTETTDTDTTDSSDEAEEAESDTTAEATDTASDPGEVTYVTDFTSIDDYMGSLDSEKPAIVIYNQQEGYLINMQEGQHYQLDSNDVIFRNIKKTDPYYDITFRVDLGMGDIVYPQYQQFIPDYSKWVKEEEFYFEIYDKEGNELGGVTCYLTPADVYLNSPAGE